MLVVSRLLQQLTQRVSAFREHSKCRFHVHSAVRCPLFAEDMSGNGTEFLATLHHDSRIQLHRGTRGAKFGVAPQIDVLLGCANLLRPLCVLTITWAADGDDALPLPRRWLREEFHAVVHQDAVRVLPVNVNVRISPAIHYAASPGVGVERVDAVSNDVDHQLVSALRQRLTM